MPVKEFSEGYFKYQKPSTSAFEKDKSRLLTIFNTMISCAEMIDKKDKADFLNNYVIVDRHSLSKIVLRVDQRKEYFTIFHPPDYHNEIKQAALIAFWVLKLQPFSINTSKAPKKYHEMPLNVSFAMFLVNSAINEKLKKKNLKIGFSRKQIENINHAFGHWDLSKEALILYAESLYDAICNSRSDFDKNESESFS